MPGMSIALPGNEEMEIDFAELRVDRRVGSGASGIVHKGAPAPRSPLPAPRSSLPHGIDAADRSAISSQTKTALDFGSVRETI